MDDLFRFVVIRPSQKKLPVFVLRLAFETSPLIIDLLQAREGENPREEMIRVAREFQEGEDFIGSPDDLSLVDSLAEFREISKGEKQIDIEGLEQHVFDVFHEGAGDLRIRQDFQDHKRRLSDSIIAVKVSPADNPELLTELSDLIRILDLLERISFREDALAIPGAVDAVLSESLILPSILFPLPPESAVADEQDEDPDEVARRIEIESLHDKASGLRRAINQLLATTPGDLRRTPTESELVVRGPGEEPELSRLTPSRSAPNFMKRLSFRLAPWTSHRAAASILTQTDTSSESRLIRPKVVERMDPEIIRLIAETGVDLSDTPVTEVLTRVEAELKTVGNRLAEIESVSTTSTIVRVGSRFVPAGSPLPAFNPVITIPDGPDVPETVGHVKPAGVGNLLIVRQQIKRYEAGEISYIGNTLQGERIKRSTRRLRRTEESFTLITERTEEEERNLQSTDRFELMEESMKTIQQDESYNIGASVSAGYGPYLQVNSNFGYSSATSVTDTAKKAFTFAQDVTKRSVSRISQRVRKEETVRTIQEFEETNEHQLDNVDGDGHIIGIYQWIDKIYNAQIYDFGLRWMFDFMVPEPAVFLIRAIESKVVETENLEAPEPFTASPENINETNYRGFIQKYRVTGAEPPLPVTTTVSVAFDASAENADPPYFTKSERVELPSGYHAWQAHAVVSSVIWVKVNGEDTTELATLRLNVGGNSWLRKDTDKVSHTFTLSEERESIAVSMTSVYLANYAINIGIECKRDHRIYEKWQIETHEAIMQGYLMMQADYEEKLAAASVQQGIEIEGRNPIENRLIERAELKKQCISLLTAQHFDMFSAILESQGTFPRINFDKATAEGRYIRFFEQAFEWENMTYVYYPYFWGRKSKWLDRILARDIDPVHAEFLKSGYARVVAPVRPGFESAVAHFLDTGEVWEGGDLPTIGNPLYVEVLDEIKERLQAPGEEIPVGDPWEVRLPTTLVRLKPENSLPEWEEDEDGNWYPVVTGSNGENEPGTGENEDDGDIGDDENGGEDEP